MLPAGRLKRQEQRRSHSLANKLSRDFTWSGDSTSYTGVTWQIADVDACGGRVTDGGCLIGRHRERSRDATAVPASGERSLGSDLTRNRLGYG
jgi:hypothetical protein